MALPPLTKLLGALLVGTSGLMLIPMGSATAGPVLVAQAPPPSSDGGAPLLIVPGQGVGPVQLGRPIRDQLARLGPTKGISQLGDGTRMYRWFEPPSNTGIGVRTNQNGMVVMVWVINDARYATKEGLHVGSTEAEVVSALGAPTRVEANAQAKTKTLIYESIGSWFSIQLDQQLNFYNTVFDIGVMVRAGQTLPSPQASPPQAAPPTPAPPTQPSPPPASPPQPSPPPPPPPTQPSPPPRPSTPPSAPQTPPPADNRLYTVQIAVSDSDRAAAIAKLLTGGLPQTIATSDIKVNSQRGFRVVSEPLPRSVAQDLVTSLAGRGIRTYIEPLGGDTVQLIFGSFASQRDAEALAQRITAQGYDAWVREGPVYTLQLGPYPQASVNSITGIVRSGAPEATVTATPAP
jgi:cell division septation protein DedD